MPKPILLLENHLDKTPNEFLLSHLDELSSCGYNTVLIEMDSQVSVAHYKLMMKDIISNRAIPPRISESSKYRLQVIEKLESLNFNIKFIDPQTMDSASSYSRYATREQIEEMTNNRDKVMFKTIKQCVSNKQNGVICIAGFMHKGLVKAIRDDVELKDNFEIGIFADTSNSFIYQRNQNIIDTDMETILTWALRPELKKDYFGSEVPFYPSFKNLNSARVLNYLGLNNPRALTYTKDEYYYRGKDFETQIGSKFKFNLDSNGVVSAESEVVNKDELKILESTIKAYHPYLLLSRQTSKEGQVVIAHGINIPTAKI